MKYLRLLLLPTLIGCHAPLRAINERLVTASRLVKRLREKESELLPALPPLCKAPYGSLRKEWVSVVEAQHELLRAALPKGILKERSEDVRAMVPSP